MKTSKTPLWKNKEAQGRGLILGKIYWHFPFLMKAHHLSQPVTNSQEASHLPQDSLVSLRVVSEGTLLKIFGKTNTSDGFITYAAINSFKDLSYFWSKTSLYFSLNFLFHQFYQSVIKSVFLQMFPSFL